ncbi:MAG: ABC transporter ATP-binding protein [Chloroflexota bacterium]
MIATGDAGVREPVLLIRNVSHAYAAGSARVEALAEINLAVDRGEIVVVVGPSGCGKTTLLHMVGGFLRPSQGEIIVNGRPSEGPDADRGMVFQHSTLYPWLTVRQNVEFGPRMRAVPREVRGALALQYLQLVGLEDAQDRRPYELSGGMQQRAAIARVLINQPQLLLMDEPFAALDALTRETMQEELLRVWNKTGSTIIFVTHSVDEATYLGTRVLVMSNRPGAIVADKRLDFSRRAVAGEGRHVKASSDFGAAREAILDEVLRAAG